MRSEHAGDPAFVCCLRCVCVSLSLPARLDSDGDGRAEDAAREGRRAQHEQRERRREEEHVHLHAQCERPERRRGLPQAALGDEDCHVGREHRHAVVEEAQDVDGVEAARGGKAGVATGWRQAKTEEERAAAVSVAECFVVLFAHRFERVRVTRAIGGITRAFTITFSTFGGEMRAGEKVVAHRHHENAAEPKKTERPAATGSARGRRPHRGTFSTRHRRRQGGARGPFYTAGE